MGIETNMSSYAEMATSADRVWQAARLYKAGRASKIIATGDYARDTTLPLLKEFGVGEEAVSFLDARTTEEEAKGIRELFSRVEHVDRVDGGIGSRKERKERKDDSRVEERGEDSRVERVEGEEVKLLLVTSAWHMKRARLMFEKYAPEIEVVCAPADFEQTMMADNFFSPKAILPDVNALYLNSVAFHEWVGIIGYRVFR